MSKSIQIVCGVMLLTLAGCGDKTTNKSSAEPVQAAQQSQVAVKNNGAVSGFSELLKAAESGSAEAQFRLAVAYNRGKGEGVPKNDERSLEFFQKSAAQGHAGAQRWLGEWYWSGSGGVAKDESKGFDLIQKSASQGDGSAQERLGYMYFAGGKLVKKDLVLAYAWFNLSAAQEITNEKGGPSATRDGIAFAYDLPKSDVSEAQKLSFNWKKGDILKR